MVWTVTCHSAHDFCRQPRTAGNLVPYCIIPYCAIPVRYDTDTGISHLRGNGVVIVTQATSPRITSTSALEAESLSPLNTHKLLHHFRIQPRPGQNIMAQTTHTGVQSVGGDGENAHRSNMNGTSNHINKSDEYEQIMHWLSPLEPRSRHQDVRTERLDGVGYWLLETSQFRQWSGGEGGAGKAVLFCFGDPGVGKTYLR